MENLTPELLKSEHIKLTIQGLCKYHHFSCDRDSGSGNDWEDTCHNPQYYADGDSWSKCEMQCLFSLIGDDKIITEGE